jgi:Family of unknown function (DUF6361)
MQEVIELFRERDTVDELGIGSVRDAFSNLLFPGTSVLQTRARYFLFIPWIYLELERRRVPSVEAAARSRRDEIRLIRALIEGGEGEGQGVIGAVAREQLKQLPSYAYWNGLEILGIRLFDGTPDRYHRSLDGYYRWLQDVPRSEGDEPSESLRTNWHPGLPPAPEGFLEGTSFDLTPEEAAYLRERIHASAPGSLLDEFASRSRPSRRVPFAWLHPDVARLPSDLGRRLQLARVFSELMYGASLLYSLMLAEARSAEELGAEHRDRLEDWAAQVDLPTGWSWDEFWAVTGLSNRRIPLSTRHFVTRWFDLAPVGRRIVDDRRARALIEDRERVTKGSQARLHNRRALELGGGGVAGQLTYRWPVVERELNDILKAAVPA